jgi:hypothetical protein
MPGAEQKAQSTIEEREAKPGEARRLVAGEAKRPSWLMFRSKSKNEALAMSNFDRGCLRDPTRHRQGIATWPVRVSPGTPPSTGEYAMCSTLLGANSDRPREADDFPALL